MLSKSEFDFLILIKKIVIRKQIYKNIFLKFLKLKKEFINIKYIIDMTKKITGY